MAATKKTSRKEALSSEAMDRWYAELDPHPAIERQKKRLRGKPRGRLAPLTAQRNLGVMLLALRRVKDALRVLDEAALAVSATGKSDPWFVGACCAALAQWVREREGARTSLVGRLEKFAKPAAHAAQDLQPELWTKARFSRALAEHWRAFEDGARRDAIDTMAFHLAETVFLREIHVLAPGHAGKVAAHATDVAIERGLRTVESKLAARSPNKVR